MKETISESIVVGRGKSLKKAVVDAYETYKSNICVELEWDVRGVQIHLKVLNIEIESDLNYSIYDDPTFNVECRCWAEKTSP